MCNLCENGYKSWHIVNLNETTCIKLHYFILVIIAFVVLFLSILLCSIIVKKIYD